MPRRDRQKSNRRSKTDYSQRMNHSKAQALTAVASQAWAQNLPYKTIALLNEALRRDPTNPDILIKLATACGKQRHYEKAEEILARLLELAPRKASILLAVARTYAFIDRPERAIECYRRSLELNRETSATVPTLLELAGLYERRHQLDDACSAVEDALRVSRATTRRCCNRPSSIVAARCPSRRSRACAPWPRIARVPGASAQALYELGQLLDESQRYDEAFAELLAAKQLIMPHATTFRQQNHETLRRNQHVVQSLDKARFERWRELPENDTTYRLAVLTGHPRSGTTLVEQVLDSHDELISADEFDVYTQWIHQPIVRRFPGATPLLTILDKVPPAVRRQARATYWHQTEAIFNQPIGDRMLLDKNPGMTIMLPAVNWAFPEIKMLIALRDPRDVVMSCFLQKVPMTAISSSWLTLPDAAEYYARTMKTWLAVRSLTFSPWLEFRYEDVVADLPGQAGRILEFLGLPWDDKVLRFYEHAREKVVRSPTYKDVTKPVYRGAVGRWQHYAKHVEPILKTLAPFVKEFGYE